MAPVAFTSPMENSSSAGTMAEGARTPAMGGTIATNNQMGTISLGTLIQYINQRTYSDLLNLAEILPRKSDMEKKIDIVKFAQRTRQLYVRLLALVKWAASASKVDKCCHIMNLLEKQNNLLTDTADKLFHMTRENLVQARLPHFHIPAAVQTLTTGTYDRLPLSIRQRILPSEPISASEKKATLSRLEQIIRHRLVTASLPHQMKTTKVENGRVVLTVDQEFEVHLTVLSDSMSDPWKLLALHILVEDRETGSGKELVHPMQVWYLQQVVQSRLVEHPHPLQELYTVLHAFALSLQLEVLYAQTLKLLEQRLNQRIRIEEYKQGCSLSLTYWRELKHSVAASSNVTGPPTLPHINNSLSTKTELGYRLTVQINPCEPERPLHLVHTPVMTQKDCAVAERAIRSEHLSMERLLVHTIYLRSKARLAQLKQTLDDKLRLTNDKCVVGGSPAVLQVPLLQPCLRSEQLLITVDTHKGTFTAHIPQYPTKSQIITDIHTALNTDNITKFIQLISELRYWLVCRRTEKSVQHLAAAVHERLPLMYDSGSQLDKLSKHKVFVTFHRHPNYVLVVEVKEPTEGSLCEVEQNLYLLLVKEVSVEDEQLSASTSQQHNNVLIPKAYLRAQRLMPLDCFLCTHGPHTKVEVPADSSSTPVGIGSNKRRMPQQHSQRDASEPPGKRIKVPAYFLPDVVQCVALCDQLCPLAHINCMLNTAGVRTGGVQVEDGGVGLVVKVISTPPVGSMSETTKAALSSCLLSFAIRIQMPLFRGVKSVVTDYIFTNVPFSTDKESQSPNRRSVVSVHEISGSGGYARQCVKTIISEWTSIAKLYHIVHYFAQYYNSSSTDADNGCYDSLCPPINEMVKVRSYNYKMISLSYGPQFSAYCNVKYSTEDKTFTLAFGCDIPADNSSNVSGVGGTSSASVVGGTSTRGNCWAINPHSLLKAQLQEEMAAAGDEGLLRLACLLHTTYQPCLALARLQPTLHPGVLEKRHLFPVGMFSVVAHSATSVRIIYRNLYCLALQMLPNGLVAIRDGAFSAFDNSRIIDEFLPIQGLKAFLSKYVDESALSRRRSQSEDDNPPTPVPLEDSPWPVPTKPSSPARHGPITPPVSSNPHTPASPHPVAGGFSASPAGCAGFALASPPSLPGMNPSPAGAHMSHPSPGAFPAASPSGGLQQHGVASPSFLTVPSPAGALGGLSSMTSPATTFLQGGGCYQMSRVLPNKTYAAAIPTLLTHHALHTLCSPPSLHQVPGDEVTGSACVLEQFLGSTYLRRNLNQACKNSNEAPSSEGGSVQFKTDSLMVCVSLVSSPINCLTLKLQPTPEFADRWTGEELQVLEKFFSLKVASAPYKPNAMAAFHQVLKFPHRILKDCVKIMQLELMGGGGGQTGAKWNVQWCLTVPPIGPQLVPPGAVGVILSKNKILFFLQLTRASNSTENDSTGGGVIVPVVHDITGNKTQMARRTEQQQTSDPALRLAIAINELMARPVLPPQESSVFPCVRELLMHLNVSPDGLPYPPTSQTPTQPPSLPTSSSQIASPRMASPLNMGSPHAPQMSAANVSTATSVHYQQQPNMAQGTPIMQQTNTLGQSPMGQTAIMGNPIGQNNTLGQPNTMGQNNPMVQVAGMGATGSMVQGNAMGQPGNMVQTQAMGQPGIVGPNMGLQGPRGMQPGMQGMPGMPQGMQPNMPGAQSGMQTSYGTNMYR